MTEIENLAQGCLVGAFVGDSAGARLEFLGLRPDNAQLDDALSMKGGGHRFRQSASAVPVSLLSPTVSQSDTAS